MGDDDDGMEQEQESRKLLVYIIPDRGQPRGPSTLVLRRAVKNAKGRFITGDAFGSFMLRYPTGLAKSRAELATLIGQAILEEIGLPPD